MTRRAEQLLLFAALQKAGVEYVVVGGVAVNAHGFVRNTRDLDLFLRADEHNAKVAFEALKSIGTSMEGFDHTDLLIDYENFQLRSAHGSVDFLTTLGSIPFDDAWRNRLTTEIDGVTVHFLSRSDLIKNKREVGRHIDLADVEELLRIRTPSPLQLPDPPDSED